MSASSTSSNLRLLILPSEDYSPIYVIAPANLSGDAALEKAHRIIRDRVAREEGGEWGEEGYSSSDALASLAAEGFDTLYDQENVFSGTGWA